MSNHFKTINSTNLTNMSKIRIKQVVSPVSERMVKKVRNSLSIGKQETNTSTKSKLLSNAEKIINSPSMKYLGNTPLYSYSNKSNSKTKFCTENEDQAQLLLSIKSLTQRELTLIKQKVTNWLKPSEKKNKPNKLKKGPLLSPKHYLNTKNISSSSSVTLGNNIKVVGQILKAKSPDLKINTKYNNYQAPNSKAISVSNQGYQNKTQSHSNPKFRNHNYKSMSAVIVKQEVNTLGKSDLYDVNKTVPDPLTSDQDTYHKLFLLKSRAASLISRYYDLTCKMINK